MCHVVVGDICVYVREMKEPFRPPDSRPLMQEGKLTRVYSRLALSFVQRLKERF